MTDDQEMNTIRTQIQIRVDDPMSFELKDLSNKSESTSIGNTYIQSTLVISKSKGLSETLRDIRISTYQMCRTEENTNRTTKFLK